MSVWPVSRQCSRCNGNSSAQVGPPHYESVSRFVQLSDKLTEEHVEPACTRDEVWSVWI